jgi:hypothetical protein
MSWPGAKLRCAAMRRLFVLCSSAACVACLVYSVWLGFPHSWRLMRSEHSRFAAMSATEREQAFGALLPLRMDIFDFYRTNLRPGDRYFIQIQNGPFGEFADKETAVRGVARLYLLPAVEARSLRDANVVLSWDSDPARLPVHYSRKTRAGLQLIFVSRILRGG